MEKNKIEQIKKNLESCVSEISEFSISIKDFKKRKDKSWINYLEGLFKLTNKFYNQLNHINSRYKFYNKIKTCFESSWKNKKSEFGMFLHEIKKEKNWKEITNSPEKTCDYAIIDIFENGFTGYYSCELMLGRCAQEGLHTCPIYNLPKNLAENVQEMNFQRFLQRTKNSNYKEEDIKERIERFKLNKIEIR